MPLQSDQTQVLAELAAGPRAFDDLRLRLCWASRTRLAAALWVLQGTGDVDTFTTIHATYYRRRGDSRPPEVRAQPRHYAGKVMA